MIKSLPVLAVLLAAISTPAWARPLQCTDLPLLFGQFLKVHYAVHDIDKTTRDRTAEQFIRQLDPTKTLLYQSEIEALKSSIPDAFPQIESGDCSAIDAAYDLAVKRTKENADYAKTFLGPKYKFEENTELVLNSDLRGAPKDAADRFATFGKLLQFQISSYLLNKESLSEAKRLLVKRYELAAKTTEEKKPAERLDAFAEAFARALDPHSDYFSQDQFEDFQIEMRLSLEGIGASLSSDDGYTIIEELIPGGAASKSKLLKPKDKIIAVAQGSGKPVSVIDMDLRDVVKLIRGKKGTKVRLTILRQGKTTQQFEVALTRDKVDLKEQAAKISFDTRKSGGKTYKIGVIDLPSFYGGGPGEGRSSYHDVKNLLRQANSKHVDGIILDLSRNGGGLLDQAVLIGGLFIKRGGIVATRDALGRIDVLDDRDPDVMYNGPLAVQISRVSASASEILAGALKSYHRALIVGGDHTFGKGTVQVLAPLPDQMGAMKVTTGMFFLPNGISTQDLGVKSDVVMPSPFTSDQIGEIKLDYPLPQGRISAFLSPDANTSDPSGHWQPMDEAWDATLQAASDKRVAADPKFTEIRKDLAEAEENKGLVKLADLRKKAPAEKKGKKEKGKHHSVGAADEPENEDNADIKEGENVLADLIGLMKK